MKLNQLHIENLRNITQAELNFSPTVNLVSGDNGAGKTSLLEAIYLLARARSFRIGLQTSIIRHGSESLILFANSEDQHSNQHKIGLLRKAKEIQIKIDGEKINKLSLLAKHLPTALVTPHSHRIIEDGPEQRRRLLNWGVFHVEHSFKSSMAAFSRSLLQRNNALRTGANELEVWDRSFVKNAEKVSEQQHRYFDSWVEEISTLSKQIPFLQDLEIKLYTGWPSDKPLSDVMAEKRKRDLERGYTTVGPQRADLHFNLDKIPVKQKLSRGQQKILITVVLIAQARMLEKFSGEKPIFLIDDLESELDHNSIDLLCQLLDEQQSQTFITTLDKQRVNTGLWTVDPRLFHVKHGSFS